MGWLLILIQILGAIPSIIKIIREIMKLIDELPTPEERKEARAKLRKTIIRRGPRDQRPVSAEEETALEKLRDELKQKARKG